MKQCQKCGAVIDDNNPTRVCPACGAPLGSVVKSDFSEKVNKTIGEIQNVPDYSGFYHPQDIEQNKMISILSYLGLLFLIPFLAKKDSPFARFHVNQGMVLFFTEAVYNVVLRIVRGLFKGTILGFIPGILGILDIAFFVLMILGIINAVNGKAKELPIIGKIRIIN